MSYKYVILEKKDKIAIITMNRPERLHAGSRETGADMKMAVEEVENDPEVRVAIITGAGERSFSAGADLKEPTTHSSESIAESFHMFTVGDFSPHILEMKKPVIAAINGYCIGGALEMALACDIMICSENATFWLPQTNLGIFPGSACAHLPRRIGKSRTMEMVLTNEWMDAQEAYRIGLVNKVVPLTELMPTAIKLAESIAAKSLMGTMLAKQMIKRSEELPLRDALLESGMCGFPLYGSEDRKEASRAWLEKREPKFTGR